MMYTCHRYYTEHVNKLLLTVHGCALASYHTQGFTVFTIFMTHKSFTMKRLVFHSIVPRA